MNERISLSLHYAYTFADYVEAQRTLYFKTPASRINIVLGTVLILLAVLEFLRHGGNVSAVVFLGLGLLAASGILSRLIQPLLIKMRWSAKLAQEYDMTISPENVHYQTATIDSTVKWAQFEEVVESPNLFLLKYAKLTYMMIPKRALTTSEDMDAFRTLLAQRIPG